MNCLHCGDCCLRMSPLSREECPHLIEDSSFYFCNDYESRPEQCVNHSFPFRHCPIGISKLGLTEIWQISQRIDEGWEKAKEIKCL